MSLFQLIITVTGFIFLIFAVDLYQRKKFNLLHFLVFFGGTAMIVIFTLNAELLDHFGSFFGIARGADLVVYISIIALAYFYFEILHKLTKQNAEITRLVSRLSRVALTHEGHEDTSSEKWFGFLIRAYNEEQMIWSVLMEILDAWYTTIVVCNDGSTDRTKDVVNAVQADYPQATILLLNHQINRWPGAANKTLFEYVTAYQATYFDTIERWVTYDADGQMDIRDMKTFEQYADNSQYDIIIGSRFVKWWNTINMPLLRKIVLIWWRVVTYFFNGSRIKDVTTWYRMYHASILPKIIITSDWFSYQHQIIDAIRNHALRFIEIPVTIKYTEYSLDKWQTTTSAWKILKELTYRTFFYK